jgi:hypothetical protein
MTQRLTAGSSEQFGETCFEDPGLLITSHSSIPRSEYIKSNHCTVLTSHVYCTVPAPDDSSSCPVASQGPATSSYASWGIVYAYQGK